MEDSSRTHPELIKENSFLKQRIKELEHAESEHKQAEGESRRLASVVRHSRELVNLATPDGTMVFLNDAGKKMLGISEEDAAQTNIMQVIPEHLNDKVRQEVLPAIEKDGFWEGDLQYLNLKTGGLTDVHAITYKITDPDTGELQLLANVSLDISDRKRVEESLQESEAKFRAIVETAPLAIYLSVGIEQKCEYINPMFIKLFGYGLEDIPTVEHWWPLAYPDETYRRQISEEWTKKVKHALETQSPIEPMEVVVTCKDGSKRNISWGYITMGDKNYACGLDLTEHRRAEEALKLSEQKYRNIYVNAMVGIFQSTPDGKYLRVNPALAAIHGFSSSDEMISAVTNIGEQLYVNPEDRKRYMDLLKKTDVIRNFEAQLYRKDRSMVWISMNVQVLRHPDGSVAYYEGIVEDITSRKQAENALRQSEEKYRGIIENSVMGIFRTTPEGHYLSANPAGVKMWGYKSQEEMIQSVRDMAHQIYVHPEDRMRFKEMIESSGSVEGFEAEFYTKGGSKIWASMNARAIRDASDNMLCYETTFEDITKRKQAEKELLRSEQKYRSLFENAVEGIFQTIPEGQFLSANPALAKLFGYNSPQEFMEQITDIGRQHYVNPGDRQTYKNILERDGVIKGFETQLINKDGSPVWASLNARAVRDEEGVIIYYEGTLEDITTRKQAEEKLLAAVDRLQEASARYETLIAASNTGAWEYHDNSGFLWCSPEYFSMLGRDIHDFDFSGTKNIEQTWIDLLHPEDRERASQHFAAYLKNPMGMYEQYFRMLHRDGRWIWIWSRGKTLWDKEGKMTSITVGTHIDITEQKAAEEAMRESEEKYRSIFENSPLGHLFFDEKGVIVACNNNFVQIIGSSREALVGLNMLNLPDKNMVSTVQKVLNGSTGLYESVYHSVTAKKVTPVRAFFAPMISEGGCVFGGVGIIEDVSDRKQAEEEKRILQERLQQADKMESIGTLAGGIAHDFNNLLMGIQGYASLSLMDIDPSHPNYERLKRIEEQVQSGADLTRQLLGFARGGRYEVKPADMNDILEKTSSMFGRTKKEITIHLKYGKDLFTVEVDQGQMGQVLLNLYVNAWHAMPGGGELYLETENVLLDDEQTFSYAVKPGNYIKISITDTGTGMDEKTRERIFDPFFTTKEMGRGTGLGLATVYGIIKGHDGFINVDSEPGHGTTFTIYLPASEKKVVKGNVATGTIARGTETILVVDDEKMVLEVSKALLESMGYLVYAAGSGQEAIAVYMEKRNEIDLVILDMIMPGISGGETFDRLKEINADIKIVLSSGYSINGQAQEIMDKGCNGFIQKPFQLEKLSSKVREMLDRE